MYIKGISFTIVGRVKAIDPSQTLPCFADHQIADFSSQCAYTISRRSAAVFSERVAMLTAIPKLRAALLADQ
jgi:hypothetical protein